MSLVVNLRHLAARDLVLCGEVTAGQLDIDTRDEVVRVAGPLSYELEVEKLDESLLVRGQLRLPLDCECVRCLKPFQYPLEIELTCHVPLEGEESVPVIGDCVDLTPYVREDILLEFPQHPLCDPGCRGLEKTTIGEVKETGNGQTVDTSAWADLDKLKL